MQADDFFAAVEERQLTESPALRVLHTGQRTPREEGTMKQHTCIECGRKFDKAHGLRIHMARSHKEPTPAEQIAGIAEGETCPESIAELEADTRFCSDIDECQADTAHTPCGADPCGLVGAPGNAEHVDLDKRLEPYCEPSKAHVTVDVLNLSAVKAELLDTTLRLIGALCEAEGVPVTFKAQVAPLVMRCRELVRP